ncbi:RNA polymerase subunit sigma, partial [Mycobacterium sp. ITM-2017-0098]
MTASVLVDARLRLVTAELDALLRQVA